ncbi:MULTISPECIES: helix-turn-helix transcriptional regulator [unclassified Rhodanobacter]|uniref:Helix-turn-helix transcriptional regulator n=1 Tax=Rhodanobacter humi TaxID=1888173 RepID=A0ABV4ASI1_9GAMM
MTNTNSSTAPDRIIAFAELKPERGISFSRVHLRRLWKAGKFPMPVQCSDRRIGWLASELDQWLANRVASRAGGDA